jgi:RHS repeat-associated protein
VIFDIMKKQAKMINKKTIQLFCLFVLVLGFSLQNTFAQQTWNPGHSIGTANGIYNYPAGGITTQLVEIYPAAIPNTGLTYQWYSSTMPTTGFSAISGATSSSYTVPAPFTVTTYYYRVSNAVGIGSVQSNTIKLSLVSVNWEDINYIREHDILNTGQTIWNVIDQLPIGSKLQTTTYLDGLGRQIEKISKQTATPPSGSNTWGDVVQFSQYDVLGREPKKYLPYTTTNQAGFYKTTVLTDQPAYYANTDTYNETSAYSSVVFDNSPLNRVNNVKESGTNWAASSGNSANYDMNTGSTGDNVQIWDVDYVQGDAPVNKGVYAANTLHKLTYTDVNSNQVIEFTNMAGQLILKKVQAVTSPTDAYTGWLCTYSVYDDFGLLRYEIQPEGVKWLYANSWNFAAANGSTVLAEQVFQYNYDDKGRIIWKKTPGAAPLNMVYDSRDRIVFMQDGNQAALSTPQWTANLYDVLDRQVATLLLNTTEPLYALQTDVANAPATTSFSVTGSSNTGGTTIPLNLSLCPGSINSSILNYGPTTVLNYMFYDNYSFANAQAFSTTYTNLNAYNTSDLNVTPIAASTRTWSMPTGSMERVLGSASSFLSSTNYYDEKGEHIQTLKSNIKSGTDITTLQYRFDGRMLSSCNSHTNSSAGYTGFITLNKYIFDYIGRLTSIQKTIGTNAAVTIANYSYDDMGRMNSKILAPGYSNPITGLSQLETLNYSFNIHNQLTGINRDYALKSAGLYSKWTHFFGMDLGYDKTDNTFSATQLNGQVAGIAWNTMGDDAQRKYDYTYDNASRLIKANFNQQQHSGDGWSNTSMDFSVSGTSGYITYDNNGNLLTMLQKGVMPGQSAPLVVDDLRYTYKPNSNKLDSVTDQMILTSLNGNFGDFKDGTNAANTSDYVYDNDGNVVIDLNKNSQSLNNGAAGTPGIHYNYLDKPDQIRIVGKGTILIVYSAGGEKLQRVFIPETGGSSVITTYIGAYTYQETSTSVTTASLPPFSGTTPHLTYMNFEEGRVRAMTTTSTTNGYDGVNENGNIVLPAAPSGGYSSGAWDYFIMDYQQNVRMILTEETHSATNMCTMESTNNRPAAEDPVFGQTGAGNEVEATRMAHPPAWTGNTSGSVCHLGRLSGHTLGPNSLQKVMAGDMVTASVSYYYPSSSPSTNPDIITNLLTSLSSLITNGGASAGTLTHGAAPNISSNLTATQPFVNTVEPDNYTSGTPQAYITILFFDERFNFISAADGGVYQAQVRSTDAGNTNAAPIGFNSEKAPKNGYVYIYISNRSDQDVFFDNLSVNITTGNIIEENHYYAYGLKIAAISSKKLGDIPEGNLQNNYQYQGSFSEMDADIGWNDFELRNYDPQIGRWMQQDPFDQFASGYLGMGDDPMNGIDPNGGISINFGTIGQITGSVLVDRLLVTAAGAGIGYAVDKLAGGNGWAGAAVGGGVGLGATFIPPFEIGNLLKTAGPSILLNLAKIDDDIVIQKNLVSSIGQISSSAPKLSPENSTSTPSTITNRLAITQIQSLAARYANTFTLSESGFNFLVQEEGVILHPYNDSKGYATIGIGHLIGYRPVNSQDLRDWSWLKTRDQALKLFRNDLSLNYEPGIRRLIKVPITQTQYDAIVSFTYNVGLGSAIRGSGLAGSRFLSELNAGRPNGDLILRFRRPPEIIGRRQKEVRLFNTGHY